MTAKEHNRLVGIFLLINGGLQLFGMLIAVVIYAIMGTALSTMSNKQDEQFIGLFMFVLIPVVIIFSLALLIPQILGGWKLLKEKTNARTWGIVGSVLACLSFPLGTAAGVYGLWFLIGDIGKNYHLANISNQNMFDTPPPPQNWA